MNILPAYFFGDIQYWSILIQEQNCIIDLGENFIKQSQRNHSKIMGPNGPLKLSVPIIRPSGEKKPTSQIEIDRNQNFKKEHLQSIKTAYSSSPFYDSFIPYIEEFYSSSWNNLGSIHKITVDLVCKILDIQKRFKYSEEFIVSDEQDRDLRIKNQNSPHSLPSYRQVFDTKHGFVSNLSILDLIFNEGKWSRDYLLNISS